MATAEGADPTVVVARGEMDLELEAVKVKTAPVPWPATNRNGPTGPCGPGIVELPPHPAAIKMTSIDTQPAITFMAAPCVRIGYNEEQLRLQQQCC
jgi:hypothetical protein